MFTSSKYNNVTPSKNRAIYKDVLSSNFCSRPTVNSNPDLIRQMKTSREGCAVRGLNSTTTIQDQFTASSRLDSISMDDASVVCGDPFIFPFPKRIKSLHNQTESPAKVFAKMKYKLNRQIGERIQTEKASPFRVKDRQGLASTFLRKGKEDIWDLDKTKENQDYDFHHYEVDALSISPIQSPRKSLQLISQFNSKPVHETPPVKDTAFNPIYTPTKRPIPEPLSATKSQMTGVSYPNTRVNEMTCRTPVKWQTPHQSSKGDNRETLALGERDVDGSKFLKPYIPLTRLPRMSPAKMFAYMKERARKRKWEPHERCEVRNVTKELRDRGHSGPSQHCAASTAHCEDGIINNTSMEVLPSVAEHSFSVNQSEANSCRLVASDSLSSMDPCDDVSPPAVKRRPVLDQDHPLCDSSRAVIKQLHVALEKLPQMSPAKMFALLKEKEMQKKQQMVDRVSSCNRGKPSSTTHDLAEVDEDIELICSRVPVHGPRLEAGSSPSEESSCEDVQMPAVKPQLSLVEDPLVIQSPRISFPNKRKAVFMHNLDQLQTTNRLASEVNQVYMTQWCLRHNRHGLYVEGILRDDNTLWHSNLIVERISRSQVKTVSGKTYVLIGRMKMDVDYGIPKWLLNKFLYGFPLNWKMYFEKFLSESKNMQAEGDAKGKSTMNQTASVKSYHHSVRQSEPRHLKPRATSTSAPTSAKLSRSGRILKPPLEYWKGGRVVVDADMNVTIHTCYETTISMLESDTPVTARETPQTSAGVFLHRDEGQPRIAPTARSESTGPLRKVKTPHCSRKRATTNLQAASSRRTQLPENLQAASSRRTQLPENLQAASSSRGTQLPENLQAASSSRGTQLPENLQAASSSRGTQLPENLQAASSRRTQLPAGSNGSNSSDEQTMVPRRSNRKHFSPQRLVTSVGPLCVNRGGRVQNRPCAKPMTKKPNSLPDAGSSSERVAPRQRNIPARAKLAEVHIEESQSDDDDNFTFKRRKGRTAAARGYRGRSALDDSQSSQSEEESVGALRKNSRALGSGKNSRNTIRETSGEIPIITRSKSSRDGEGTRTNAPQARDEDMWAEAELERLQKAVASCPKHMGNYWVNVAMMVGTRSAEECQRRHACQGRVRTSPKKAKKSRKKEEPVKGPESPKITARVGTLKRKEQVRQFMEAMPKENHDDAFTCAVMQNKRFQLPSVSSPPLGGKEHVFRFTDQEPMTPGGAGFPTVKTPQCLHITPGMMGSVNRKNDDNYIFQLQKRMKRNQVNKHGPSLKGYTPKPSVKRAMKRCSNAENDSFVVWEMFPDNEGTFDESEEEDFYFSDDN